MIVELKVSLYFSLSGGRKEDFSWKWGDWLTQELLSSDWKLGSRHEITENNRTTIQPIRKKQLCVYQSDWNCFRPPRQTKILAHSSTQQSSNVLFVVLSPGIWSSLYWPRFLWPGGRMSRHDLWYSARPHWLCCDTGARWHRPVSAPRRVF